MLLKGSPHVACLDCRDCKKWLHDEDWKPLQRHGKRVPRGSTPTPCDDPNQQDCPKGHYDNPKTLSERNLMAYQYIKEGEAVGWRGVPVDSVVRRNAAIVREIEENSDRHYQFKMIASATGVASLAGASNVRR